MPVLSVAATSYWTTLYTDTLERRRSRPLGHVQLQTIGSWLRYDLSLSAVGVARQFTNVLIITGTAMHRARFGRPVHIDCSPMHGANRTALIRRVFGTGTGFAATPRLPLLLRAARRRDRDNKLITISIYCPTQSARGGARTTVCTFRPFARAPVRERMSGQKNRAAGFTVRACGRARSCWVQIYVDSRKWDAEMWTACAGRRPAGRIACCIAMCRVELVDGVKNQQQTNEHMGHVCTYTSGHFYSLSITVSMSQKI